MIYKIFISFIIALFSFSQMAVKAQDSLSTFADLVPFVTTPWEVVDAMLELADVEASDRIIDLGSGDGRIPIRAAVLYGTKGMGVEIDAELVEEAKKLAAEKGVSQLVDFIQGDLFEIDFSEATVLTLYLFPDINLKLMPKILTMRPGTRIVSHRFGMGDWEPKETRKIILPDGKEHLIFLWVVP
jgi:SAM-dependent methyltransferase